MIEVTYSVRNDTKNWRRFEPSHIERVEGDVRTTLNQTKDVIVGPLYFPLDSSKEDFKVIIDK